MPLVISEIEAGNGVRIFKMGRLWYKHLCEQDNSVCLNIDSQLDPQIYDEYKDLYINVEDKKNMFLNPETKCRLIGDEGVCVEFLIQVLPDNCLKFVFFRTGPGKETNYTGPIHDQRGGKRSASL